MTVALIARELIVVARRPALAAAAALYIALLAGVTLIWGLKLPMLTGASFFSMLRVFHSGVLAALMPWVVARCLASDRGDGLVMLSTLAARRPSSIVLAKIVSLTGVLALVVLTGTPAVIIAGKMSALPTSAIARDVASSMSIAVLVSVVTIAWRLRTGDAIAAWIGGAVTTACVLAVAGRWTSTAAANDASIVAVAVAAAAAVAWWSDRAFQYCHE
jgi:hypothetical protein